jgi:hypothetical protein
MAFPREYWKLLYEATLARPPEMISGWKKYNVSGIREKVGTKKFTVPTYP